MTDRFLAGRTALVTGSTSGIGLAIATALGAAGAAVIVHGLGSAEEIAQAERAVRDAGAARAQFLPGDLADPAAIEALMQAAGPLDILVNNAGIQHTAPVANMPPAQWDRILAINLSAVFHTLRLALPGMAERGFGRVVNIASVHGLVASVQKAPYVAAKHGVIGLSKVAALEYAAQGDRASGGITINCICPGFVETALIEPQIMVRAAQHGGDRDAGIRDLLGEKQPSLRMTLPDEIGALALWLCRREAHNLNGAAIPVDGGWTAA
ncbi:MAG: 3-hydroxybutyrate dehydrogenase [Rhodanobacteraceae bacterium]|nr:3-hydroxybutyrate dehydrogenase [Rhodanobacteraceae bacterium]